LNLIEPAAVWKSLTCVFLLVGDLMMRRAALLVTLLLCWTTLHGASQTMTVLQWNVFHGGRGTDSRSDAGRQVNWIAAKHPDVVSLNEVTSLQAEEYRQRLDTATGDRWFSHHVTAQADGIGNQILTRHQLLATDAYHMRANGQFRRAVTQATVDISGQQVNVFSTHLDNSSGEIREAQVRELIMFISRFPEPRIVAGDLNAPPGAPEIGMLQDRLFDAWTEAVEQERAIGYPDNPAGPDTRTRGKRIDYILHSPELTVVQAEVPDQRDWSTDAPAVQVGTSDDVAVRPSDHNFLFAVLSFSSRGGGRQRP
jgi:endonuclease/exonuclease/phosphatase family metal-dependent hydrolase